MDAYDISDKIKKYWCAVVPKNSGELNKSNKKVRVVINTPDGYREVVGVHITDNMIELELEKRIMENKLGAVHYPDGMINIVKEDDKFEKKKQLELFEAMTTHD